jgi:uncharacterized protein (TIGR03084 family)
MTLLDELLDDLAAEGDMLRALVAELPPSLWRAPTPAEGWDVATTISHLAWTDEVATFAATDMVRWDAVVSEALKDPEGYVDARAHAGARAQPAELLDRWDAARTSLGAALRAREGKLPWFGPPMSPASMATARLMETWAHGLDVYEAVGVCPQPSDRIRHICHLGVRTRDFAYAANLISAPREEFRVELVAPGGARWTWGPEGAQRVGGSAWDFARLVTQRVHRTDTDLVAEGPEVDRWLSIAQAFAGPPGAGRGPR